MVGLSEISYTNSWFNVLEHDYFHLLSAPDPNIKLTQKVTLAPGRYKSLDQIISEVHNRVEKNANKTHVAVFPKLSYDEASRRVFVIPGKSKGWSVDIPLDLQFSKDLGDMLGISSRKMACEDSISDYCYVSKDIDRNKVLNSNTFMGTHPYDLTRGIHSLMVYTDIVEYNIVGNTRAQLLKIVEIPTSSQFGDQVVVRYDRPQYRALASNHIRSIEIEIKDDANERIQFRFGRVIPTLHFIKVS